MTRTSITNIEKGRQPVQAHTLVILASILQMPVVELLPPSITAEHHNPLASLEASKQEWVLKIADLGDEPL